LRICGARRPGCANKHEQQTDLVWQVMSVRFHVGGAWGDSPAGTIRMRWMQRFVAGNDATA
jgi:hypothetical protein